MSSDPVLQMKAVRARLVVERRAILAKLRERPERWSALHKVCREIANIDSTLAERVRNDFSWARGPRD